MLINVKKLSAYYQNNRVFSDVSFAVHRGDYLCITGENGSGKTTLMRALLGLPIKYTGSIEYIGLSKNRIGWLPQHTEGVWDFPANVREVVLSAVGGKRFFGMHYTKAQNEKAAEYMKLVGIGGFEKKSFRELSGGQRQKVLLCRALCAADDVLLLDEPAAGLDADSQEELYAIINRLNKSGMAIIMITHDISRVGRDAKHILNLCNDAWFYGDAKNYIKGGNV